MKNVRIMEPVRIMNSFMRDTTWHHVLEKLAKTAINFSVRSSRNEFHLCFNFCSFSCVILKVKTDKNLLNFDWYNSYSVTFVTFDQNVKNAISAESRLRETCKNCYKFFSKIFKK